MMENSKTRDSQSLATFLILECIAMLSFCLGGISTIFHYVGFAIAVIAIFTSLKVFDKKECKSLLIIGIPLLIIAICCSFGNLYNSKENIVANIGLFVAIPSYFILGLVARRYKSLKAETILLCIGGGLALLVLISLISTWVQYGFFYTLIYRDTPAYYYNGVLYDITNEASWLNGFNITEVSLSYSGLFGVLLCSALPALLFISPKKDRKKFIIVSIIGGIGLLSVLTLMNVTALIFLVPVLIISLVYKFLKDKQNFMKVLFIILKVIFVIALVLLVFAFLNAIVPSINNFTSNVGFLNRLFNSNRIMRAFNEVISAAFKPYNLFGFPYYASQDFEGKNAEIIMSNYHIFELEIVKEGGIFALFGLIAIILICLFSFIKYLKLSKDSDTVKIICFSFVVSFLIYCSFNWDNSPFTHEENFLSFSRSFPAMLILFILGFTFFPFMKENPKFNDDKIVENCSEKTAKVEYIDTDYVFTDYEEKEENDE